jgi:hypothetical protein
MRSRYAAAAIALAAVVVASHWRGTTAGQGQGAIPTPGQFAGYTPPRTYDGRPNLNGIWQSFTNANYNLEDQEAQPGPYYQLLGAWGAEPAVQSIIEGGLIPYQPAALAKRKQNFETRVKATLPHPTIPTSGDPELKCFMPGVPRANYMPYPFQIVQQPDFILIAYTFARAVRIIRMEPFKDASPVDNTFWMGWSLGRWEGNTLVVDVTAQQEQTWFDRAGNFHSDALHVVERFTPASPYHMMYEATIEDPKVFTRPWRIRFPLYRRMEQNVQILEHNCVPFAEEIMYGNLVKKEAGN